MFSPFEAKLKSNVPLYHQISMHLREQIVSGKIPPGTQLPKGQELSKTYGVAYRTMVKSLAILKKEGLLVGIPSQGTFTRKKKNTVRNIAIVFDQQYMILEDFASQLDVFQRAGALGCEENGFHLQLFSLPNYQIFNEEEPPLLSRLLQDRYIDGLITYSGPSPEDVKRLVRMSVPTVVSRDMYPKIDVPWVIEDAADGAVQLIRFLVGGLGHRRVKLVLSFPPDAQAELIRPSTIFGETLISELKAAGICPGEDDVAYAGYDWETAAPTIHRWLASDPAPTALIFCDDTIAQKTLSLAQEMGLNIPGDLSIASYGGILSRSPLTGIHIPIHDIARKCVELLEQMFRGEGTQSVTVPTKLIIRKTCGPAARA